MQLLVIDSAHDPEFSFSNQAVAFHPFVLKYLHVASISYDLNKNEMARVFSPRANNWRCFQEGGLPESNELLAVGVVNLALVVGGWGWIVGFVCVLCTLKMKEQRIACC